MEWGEQLATLLEIEKSTGETPKALQARPAMKPEGLEIYQTFNNISNTRHYSSAGMQPLQVSELASYLETIGLSGQEKRDVLEMMLSIDRGYMRSYFKKMDKLSKKESGR
jgi:hypothetical protein